MRRNAVGRSRCASCSVALASRSWARIARQAMTSQKIVRKRPQTTAMNAKKVMPVLCTLTLTAVGHSARRVQAAFAFEEATTASMKAMPRTPSSIFG